MTNAGWIILAVALSAWTYGTYTVGYWMGAKAAIEQTVDLAIEKGLDIKKMLTD